MDIPDGKTICDSNVCDRRILPPDISDYRVKGDFVGVVPLNQLNEALNNDPKSNNIQNNVSNDSVVISKKSIVLFSIFTVLSGIGVALYLNSKKQ